VRSLSRTCGGGLGWGCLPRTSSSSGWSFPHPPRLRASTSPASGRGELSPRPDRFNQEPACSRRRDVYKCFPAITSPSPGRADDAVRLEPDNGHPPARNQGYKCVVIRACCRAWVGENRARVPQLEKTRTAADSSRRPMRCGCHVKGKRPRALRKICPVSGVTGRLKMATIRADCVATIRVFWENCL
jgi:hypothetical protein